MDKFNLIIDENQSLYEILKESNIGTHYQLILANNNISELISKSGTYEIHIEIFNEKYSQSVSMTETLRVK